MQTSIALPAQPSGELVFFRVFEWTRLGWRELRTYDSFDIEVQDRRDNPIEDSFFDADLQIPDFHYELIFPEAWPPDLIADYLEGQTATAA
jgi:hypothetical protein